MNEASSDAVANWSASSKTELGSAAWCVPEFASALGIKQRTGHWNAEQAARAWQSFERLTARDVRLLPVDATDFHRDALHLACAKRAVAKAVAMLDAVMAGKANRLKLKAVVFA